MGLFLKLWKIILLFSTIILCSCVNSDQTDAGSFFNDEINQSFEQVLILMDEQDVEGLRSKSIKDLAEMEEFEESLKVITKYLSGAKEAKFIYAQNRFNEDPINPFPIYYGVFEFQDKDGQHVLLELTLQKYFTECCYLRHVKIKKTDGQPSTHHNFKSQIFDFKRGLFIALMILNLIFILFTIFVVIRDKKLRLKILWVIFIAMGTYGAALNYSNGEISPNFIRTSANSVNFSIIKFQLLGSSITKTGLFEPWILEIGLPLGAIIYWFKRQMRRRPNTESEES